MKYLKTIFESVEYNAIQGYEKSNNRIELIEDANGDYFTNSENKDNLAFTEILDSLNAMEETDSINFKVNESI